ncbi:MAG: hypothetical protein IJW41_03140 [Oscillospiraceae bacterium]|nr:hypothetical protein [Oscillospiraceae bacterium]
MKDLPAFTTENGVASIVLQEIPYSKTAYVILRDSLSPTEFIKECGDFCRAAGAERVYATGHDVLTEYPYHTAIWKMEGQGLPDLGAVCVPVTEDTLAWWCAIYNRKMASVPNAVYMGKHKKELILAGGCFIYEKEVLLGIGMVSDGIDAVASLVPGGGEKIVSSLCHKLGKKKITLQVALENQKAVSLYERLGFQKQAELGKWYKIFEL